MASTSATQLAARIEDDIVAGRRSAGDALPPVRTHAEQLGISPTTVAAAYRRLRERGLVVGKGRQGTLVAPPSNAMRVARIEVPDGVIDASSGTPDPALLPSLGPALAAAAAQGDVRYGDAMIDPTLAAVGRAMFEFDGIDATHLAVTSGAMDAIERIIAAQGFRVGDRIAVEDPGHVPVHQLCRSAGLELVAMPVDEAGVTVEGLRGALERDVVAVIVTPRAQNPTGAAFTTERSNALSALLAERPEVMVIQDDHAGAVSGAAFHPLSVAGARWAMIRSLGKSLGPDLRVALVAADARTIDRLSIALSNGPGWVSRLLQRAAAWLLDDADSQRVVADAAERYRDRCDRLVATLGHEGVPSTAPSGFNVWIPVEDEQAAVEALRGIGVAARAAAQWRITSPPAIRLTSWMLTDGDIDRIAEVLGRLRRQRGFAPTM